MTEPHLAAGREAAGRYLRELLLRPGRYRQLWESHAQRSRPGAINHLAVADVLAQHLWESPRAAGHSDVLAHQLKDTVGRALSGRLLSRSTLDLFVAAFGFSSQEQERLWRLWRGSGRITVLTGPRAMRSGAAAEVAGVLGPRRHQTVSLHDHVYADADRRLARTRTLQVVEALADGLDAIPYLYDTNAVTLELGQGCAGAPGPVRRIGELYGTDIRLARSLSLGETITLEYWTSYHYDGNAAGPSERQYRRAVMNTLENFDMRIQFHPDQVPDTVWWAVWDGVEGRVLEQERVTPDSQYSVHRYLRSLERSVVGFHWSWEPAGAMP
ncbi:MAG: hypothetical protein ACLP5E_15110 [Streptosporangiaceae bacterium]